jgi:predicted AlkP superfamily phosphohydrolase/phosphomutase
MSWTTYRNKPDAYLDEAYEVTAKRIKVSEHLMDNTEWDLMASVWVSIDRTQHALSNYVAPDHPDYLTNRDTRIGRKTADIFRQADEALGSFVSRARPDDLILFISDHGFQSCTRTVSMDRLLKEFGYLDFSASSAVFGPMQWGPMRKVARKVYDTLGLHGKVALPQSVNWSKTKAYTTIRSTGEGVSINLAGREIDGIVDPGDYDRVRDELLDRLGSFVDPKTGKTPVKEIYKREEIFKGRFADTAPDILMVPNEGYSLTHSKTALEDADWVSGDHRIEGTIVAVGPHVKPFESPPALIDMAPTLVAALGAPTAVEPTGRVLQELLGAEAQLVSREASSDGIPGMDVNEAAVTDTEADEMEEHLRGLGYIEGVLHLASSRRCPVAAAVFTSSSDSSPTPRPAGDPIELEPLRALGGAGLPDQHCRPVCVDARTKPRRVGRDLLLF